MPLLLPNDIVNGALADALPVEENYNLIQSYINNQLIHADGSVAMTAPLLLPADPTQAQQAATKAYVDALLPIGIILPFAAPAPPTGAWLACDGSAINRTAWPALFDLMDYRFGGTVGSGTALLPNLQGRIPVGLSTKTEFNTVGKAGGTYAAPLLAHLHAMPHTHQLSHTHEHPHTHIVNPTTVNSSFGGSHNHGVQTAVRSSDNPGGTHSFVNAGTDGTPAVLTDNPAVQTDGGHFHTVDVPSTLSAQPNDATTSDASTTTTGTPSAANTASTGTAAVEHLAPYVTVTYIIRAG